eukprot:gnl/Spiro4/25077_TR12479_c0_g1_i1.p2 gnl/Spiro4/25077_TR12479_c0_g1~~gnl/Spiro4/25077_TR12479_c0_g1_i1.p2  ORF type:complete len:259 (-),score=42.49 gnl/Spiro4/25077_TR12479_c0_g1_i1:64-804(-)
MGENGDFHLTIKKGLDLDDHGRGETGGCDPYVEVWIGPKGPDGAVDTGNVATTYFKTRVLPSAGANPIWNADFQLKGVDPRHAMLMKVMDEQRFSDNRHLGQVMVELGYFRSGEMREHSFRVGPAPGENKSFTGEIVCIVTFTYDTSLVPQSAPAAAAAPAPQYAPPQPQYAPPQPQYAQPQYAPQPQYAQPGYYQPQPQVVYAQPQVVYAQPQVVYAQPTVYAQPATYAYPVYEGHHHHHKHHHD